ncbi:hypothetical protein ABFX02_12G102600 [Erythranthe guttata]
MRETEAHQDEEMENLRSKATELLLREEYKPSIQAYAQIISLCQTRIAAKNPDGPHLNKLLCLSFSNRAEARARLSDHAEALRDCEEALRIDDSHFKTLVCKGKILLSLNRYSAALCCFNAANLGPQATENSDLVNGFLEKCKRLEFLSRTGAFDISEWVLSGFRGKSPELAEYIGALDIKKSEISGRGLFATKNVESGTLLFVTKAVAVDRAIMPQDSGENAHLVIWKNFVDKVSDAAGKCSGLTDLISNLSSGEEDDENTMEVPRIGIFRPEETEAEEFDTDSCKKKKKLLDMGRLLSILDANSFLEDSISAKVLGKNADYQGVGLWVLASLINHSCEPNVRRLHVGDHVVVHASRDLRAGEELTFAYFDVLSPLSKRREMARSWGFVCGCKRCKFEENLGCKHETREMEILMMGGKGGVDMGGVVYRLEEGMRRWGVRGRGKGYLRGSFWEAYSKVFGSEKVMRKWWRKIPEGEAVVDSVVDAVGSDERVVKVYLEGLKRGGSGGGGGGGGINGVVEMEKAMKLARGVYGKVMKKHALRSFIHFGE